MKKSKTTKVAAVVTLRNAGLMSKRGRKDIAAWLRRQAASLIKHGGQYTPNNFTARYHY